MGGLSPQRWWVGENRASAGLKGSRWGDPSETRPEADTSAPVLGPVAQVDAFRAKPVSATQR